MRLKRGATALYYGHRVTIVSDPRWVAGGAVVDVERHPSAHDWPWTVSRCTTNVDHLVLA